MRPLVVALPLLALGLTGGCAHQSEAHSQDVTSHLPACTSVRVHFALDRSSIGAVDRGDLERAARCMKADQALNVVIQRNADEAYELSLGDRRAHAVAGYLRSLNAAESQLQMVSYGEERQVCGDHDQACWTQDERADSGVGDSSSKGEPTPVK